MEGVASDQKFQNYESLVHFLPKSVWKVVVSRGALVKAVDAIGRCHLAAEHARKMFQNAGAGFEAEANSMSDALDVLKTELGLDPAQRGPY